MVNVVVATYMTRRAVGLVCAAYSMALGIFIVQTIVI